jgi:uncharacterized membrane protein YgdD (TMEM256/DUF423 family)
MLAVAAGAFGAHVLRARLGPDAMAVYQTAVLYQLFHALGLLCIGLMALPGPREVACNRAGMLMFAGVVLFSGSLYLLALSGWRMVGAITPVGGILMLGGWLMLAWALRGTRQDEKSDQ